MNAAFLIHVTYIFLFNKIPIPVYIYFGEISNINLQFRAYMYVGDLCDEGPCEENENYCANGGTCSNVMSGSGVSFSSVQKHFRCNVIQH